MSAFKKSIFTVVLCALITFPVPSSFAHDHDNIEEGLPVELEDAYPTEYLNREFQQQSRFDLTDRGRSQFTLDQRIEYGIVRNGQVSVSLPVQLGTAVHDGLGQMRVRGLYNFNSETPMVPAFAISGGMDLPTSQDSAGVDTVLKGILSKTVPHTSKLVQVHFNGAWLHNSRAKDFERSDRYKLVMGSSFRISPSIVGLVDYVREQQISQGKTSDIIEVGTRHMVTPLTTIGIGLGMGLSNDSPRFRATLSVQHAF